MIIKYCQALCYMNLMKTTISQIACWRDLIQDFDTEVKHRPDAKMCHVDAMSRAPILESSDTLTSLIEQNLEVYHMLIEKNRILVIQHADRELRKLIEILQKEQHERTTEEKKKVNNYVLKEKKLYRKVRERGKEKLLYVIPKSMRKKYCSEVS